MGTRLSALTDHRVPDYRSRERVLSLLAPTLPSVRTVADYWRAVQPDHIDTKPQWSAYFLQSPSESDYLRYDGPGGVSVRFGERVACIHAGCRWRGFLSIEAIRRVHLAAIQSIADVLGGTRIAFFHDAGVADDLLPAAIYDGIGLSECIAMLQRKYGAPQPSIAKIASEIIAETEHQVPSVWYLEALQNAA